MHSVHQTNKTRNITQLKGRDSVFVIFINFKVQYSWEHVLNTVNILTEYKPRGCLACIREFSLCVCSPGVMLLPNQNCMGFPGGGLEETVPTMTFFHSMCTAVLQQGKVEVGQFFFSTLEHCQGCKIAEKTPI